MNSWSKIWSSVGRAEESLLSSLHIRLRAAGETVLGMENLLAVMRIYVSFSVDVSKGGRPTSNAYLKIEEFRFYEFLKKRFYSNSRQKESQSIFYQVNINGHQH